MNESDLHVVGFWRGLLFDGGRRDVCAVDAEVDGRRGASPPPVRRPPPFAATALRRRRQVLGGRHAGVALSRRRLADGRRRRCSTAVALRPALTPFSSPLFPAFSRFFFPQLRFDFQQLKQLYHTGDFTGLENQNLSSFSYLIDKWNIEKKGR